MSETTVSHSLAPLVTRLVSAAELEGEAVAQVDPGHGPKEFIDALAEVGLYPDALKFLAHLLPRREAVWWAWMCARKEAGEDREPELDLALKATERWVAEPTDEHRRAAMKAAEGATYETAAGCAALAAFLSQGSMAPPNVDEVPPPRFATARAVFGSLVLAAVAVQPERAQERFRRFLGFGLELAERIHLWETLERPN
ncbi:MAG: hypothetical protein GEU90_18435 [Gemmatimonas sp.]|nr:hypothetical protein [Gemmatimonas sp.]